MSWTPGETCNYESGGRVTTDAVQRIFMSSQPKKNGEAENGNVIDAPEYFYCQQCNLKILGFVNSGQIKSHFEEKNHEKFSDCVYCKKAVYKYILNAETKIYHNCKWNDKL